MFRTYMRALFLIACLLWLEPTAAHAQVVLTITPDQQSAAPEHILTFTGTLTNTSSTEVFLNSDIYNLSGGSLTLDDTKFGDNAPLSLAGGATTAPFPLFDVTVGPTALPGSYIGTFTVKGGSTNSVYDELDTSNFTVNVTAPDAVPEMILSDIYAGITVAAGCLWLYVQRVRRRKSTKI